MGIEEKIENQLEKLASRFKFVRNFLDSLKMENANLTKVLVIINLLMTCLIFTVYITPWIFVIVHLVIPVIAFKFGPIAGIMGLVDMLKDKSLPIPGFMITVMFMMINQICLFACFYMLFGVIADNNGQTVTGLWEHIYFSVVTITTLGYGNMVPANTVAEVLASLEAIIGFGLFAFLIGVTSASILEDRGV